MKINQLPPPVFSRTILKSVRIKMKRAISLGTALGVLGMGAVAQEWTRFPAVGTATGVATKGSVGQMDDLLLRKVEELTLYIIEQQKQMDAMKAEIKSLKKQ